MTTDDATLVPSAIAVLAATPSVFRVLLARLPEPSVSAPGAEGWSARDVVAHLAGRTRPAMIERIGAMLAHDGAAIPDIPDDLTEVDAYRALPLGDVLATFDTVRDEAIALVRSISPAQLTRRGVHSVAGDVTVADIIHHLAYHDLLHLEQATRLIYAPLEERRGAMRMF